LITDDTTFLGSRYVNGGEVHASGLEFEGQLRINSRAQAHFSYALQRAIDQDTDDELPNSPRHIAKGRISFPAPWRGASIAVEGHYKSSRQTILGSRLGSAGIVNVTVTQPLGRSWELMFTARNLFDMTYDDPVSSAHLQEAIAQNGRTARIGLTWKFWRP
jgi:iron complex outermembrane receptor protein